MVWALPPRRAKQRTYNVVTIPYQLGALISQAHPGPKFQSSKSSKNTIPLPHSKFQLTRPVPETLALTELLSKEANPLAPTPRFCYSFDTLDPRLLHVPFSPQGNQHPHYNRSSALLGHTVCVSPVRSLYPPLKGFN